MGAMTTLKPNEARPVLRVLAGLAALPGWAAGVVALLGKDWWIGASSLLFALSFSYLAIAGYMPRIFVRLFARGGSVSGQERMR
ncbi:hypothetical protein AGMMS50256_13470 [Betaproteobacteria bacterium]|nr:hypothetical protein AGMMS50256_13470 [Betaproteobacteria bacterium]